MKAPLRKACLLNVIRGGFVVLLGACGAAGPAGNTSGTLTPDMVQAITEGLAESFGAASEVSAQPPVGTGINFRTMRASAFQNRVPLRPVLNRDIETGSRTESAMVTRACQILAPNVAVTLTYAGIDTYTVTTGRGVNKLEINYSGQLVRRWTNATGTAPCCGVQNTVGCVPGGGSPGYALIDWSNPNAVNGLVAVDTIGQQGVGQNARNFVVKVTPPRGARVYSRSTRVQGVRNLQYGGHSVAGDTISFKKQVQLLEVNRSRQITMAGGAAGKLFSYVQNTPSDAPFVIAVERVASSQALRNQTVESGTLVLTGNAEFIGRVELSFQDVVFETTGQTLCIPTSGKVTGKYFGAALATTASREFTVEFGQPGFDSGIKLSNTGDGTSREFTELYDQYSNGCGLDER